MRSRQRLKEAGSAEFMIRLQGETLELIDELAKFENSNRIAVLQKLLTIGISHTSKTINKLTKQLKTKKDKEERGPRIVKISSGGK